MISDGISKIIQRLGGTAEEGLITKTYRYLERSKGESGVAKEAFVSKEREAEILEKFCEENKLWYEDTRFSIYLDEGAEQKVFYDSEVKKVIKFNDAIFYVNWTQYLESLIIHNILFTNTSYTLLGFIRINTTIFSVVEQDYIEPTETTNLQLVKKLMENNGFHIKKGNDYINDDLGIIVEDLHEENVLTFNGTLFFIDTVIYLKN